jgi:hypothetical protein
MIRRSKNFGVLAVLAILSLSLGGCLVEVKKFYDDPGPLFAAVEDQLRLARSRLVKGETPRQVHLMVYDRGSQDLVRVRVPFWLLAMFDDEDSIARFSERFKDRRWADSPRVRLSELKSMGPGVVVRINDDDARLLLWLE